MDQQRIIEKIRMGSEHYLNAQDHGIVEVRLPVNGDHISRITFQDGRLVETNKPVEVWYRGQSC
jgi:hypothetical protein